MSNDTKITDTQGNGNANKDLHFAVDNGTVKNCEKTTSGLKKISEWKCISCKHENVYYTGGDEYPAYTGIVYCSKGHWENGSPESMEDDTLMKDFWADCKDYESKVNKEDVVNS